MNEEKNVFLYTVNCLINLIDYNVTGQLMKIENSMQSAKLTSDTSLTDKLTSDSSLTAVTV